MRVVVAALIEREGCLLVGQRRRDGPFPLKWEFPGGKVRPGETPAEALARELREELGVSAAVGAELYRTRHRYAELSDELLLIFFAARIEGEPQCLAFEQVCWVERSRLDRLDFLAADRELVMRLAAGDWALS
jgi:mutator protein MutT